MVGAAMGNWQGPAEPLPQNGDYQVWEEAGSSSYSLPLLFSPKSNWEGSLQAFILAKEKLSHEADLSG